MDRSDSFDSPEPPHDEAWWERAFFQNEKLMDKYMDVWEAEPDPSRFADPRALYEAVHGPGSFNPPEDFLAELEAEQFDELTADSDEAFLSGGDPADENDANRDEDFEADDNLTDGEFAEYTALREAAFELAVRVMNLDDLPEHAEGLYTAAGKVGANLVGGHSLGYDEDSLCGNIVKCRWSLAECEFCIDTLDFYLTQQGRSDLTALLEQARSLKPRIKSRIASLRRRVWW